MTTPEARLNPETLDELLSADIDGEFERAAAELGFTVDEARTAMHASPGMRRRRAELARARDLLAAAVPVAPSVTSQLVSTALDHSDELRSARARRARSVRTVISVGSAAAVIAGVVAFATINHQRASSSTAAPATAPLSHPPGRRIASGRKSGRLVDFGDVTRPATLRAVIEMRLRTTIPAPAPPARRSASAITISGPDIVAKLASMGTLGLPGAVALQGPQGLEGVQGLQGDFGIAGPTGPTGPAGVTGPAGANGGTGVQGGIGPQGPSGVQGAQGPTGSAPAKTSGPLADAAPTFGTASRGAAYAASGCATTIERRARQRSVPVLSGYGTDAGRPVVIVVFSQAHRYVAYVLAPSDCAVVTHQTLP